MPAPRYISSLSSFRLSVPDVQHDREHPARVHAGGGGVDGELADGDLDAADALVADAQDALGVGGDDQVDVIGAETRVAEGGLDVLGMIDRQVDAARAAVLWLNRSIASPTVGV